MPREKLILNDNISEIKDKLNENNYITVGIKTNNDKIISISQERVKELAKICDFLLIEADGAKMIPLKVPAKYEPVIFDISHMVIGVCGIDALNKKICHIWHRPHIVSKVLNKGLEDNIEIKDIAYILSSKEGQMKNVRDYMEYRVIINKVDNDERLVSS